MQMLICAKENQRIERCIITSLLLMALGIAIISICILCLTPPVSRDALSHHLAVPKLFLNNGGIHEIPSVVFSYYPMNIELLYMLPLYFGNDIAPKFIHFGFGILTAWLIFYYLKKRLGFIYGLLGALTFLSIPIIVRLSITVYVDLGLIFFSTASLLLILKWSNDGFNTRTLILAAIYCGLAMGTKYNGLITFFLICLFVPFIYARNMQKGNGLFLRSCLQGLIFAFVAVLFFSPWMIRNFLWTHNPIYPLYDQWFHPDGSSHRTIGFFAYRAIVYQEQWWEIALLPIRIFFQGQDNVPKFFDGKLTTFLLIFPLCAISMLRKAPIVIRKERMILITFSVLYFTIAFFSVDLRIRYIAPIIPPLLILSFFGISDIFKSISYLNHKFANNLNKLIIVMLIIGYLFNFGKYIYNQFEYIKPFDCIRRNVTRDEYITRYRPEYRVMMHINKYLPAATKILFFFMGKRGYYCDREYLFDMRNNISMIQMILKKESSSKGLWDSLHEIGITHLLIYEPIFEKWVDENYNNDNLKILKQFFDKCCENIYSYHGYTLFKMNNLNNLV